MYFDFVGKMFVLDQLARLLHKPMLNFIPDRFFRSSFCGRNEQSTIAASEIHDDIVRLDIRKFKHGRNSFDGSANINSAAGECWNHDANQIACGEEEVKKRTNSNDTQEKIKKNHMIPKKVLVAFGFTRVTSTKQLASGLIHQTYRIKNDRKQYIIQRLHPVLASKEIANDFLVVTKYLKEEKFLAPECLLSKKGEVLVDDGEWKWRVQTFVPGKTVSLLKDAKMATEAGKIYARFHETVALMPYKFQSKKILHDTEELFEKFRHTVDAYRDSELMLDVIHDVVFLLEQTPRFFLPNTLPLRVIHGDPKISNILFDKVGKAIGTITLELACRFMTDYFVDDYFGWDASRYASRRAHNLARARGQIVEFKDYLKKREIIEKIIQKSA